jgi:histidinol-phosphatase (PHP family)
MSPVDYHNHTWLCHHARGGIEQYLPRAAALGLQELGFAEHSHWMVQVDPRRRSAPTRQEMDIYLGWMQEWRAKPLDQTMGVQLRFGLEADWLPKELRTARAFIADHPFDHVLGSVHHLRDPHSSHWRLVWDVTKSDDAREWWTMYFDAVRDLALSGLCDVIAHIDVPARARVPLPAGHLQMFEAILPDIVDSGVAIEINTSGRDHKHGVFFPSKPILRLCVEAGVPVTLGSDGHAPWHLGRYRGLAMKWLRECGAGEVAAFEMRRRRMIPLPPEAP